jgi:hypothetical protein
MMAAADRRPVAARIRHELRPSAARLLSETSLQTLTHSPCRPVSLLVITPNPIHHWPLRTFDHCRWPTICRYECMKHIIDNEADIVNLNSEELYLAGRLYNLEPFAMEQYDGGELPVRASNPRPAHLHTCRAA